MMRVLAPPAAMNPKANISPGGRAHIRVLIADDSPPFRAALSQWLGQLPPVELVGSAGDGEEALVLVARTRPDLVLLDLIMPRRNGLEVLGRLCADFPEARVIIITLHALPELRAASLAAGADRFIGKHSLRAELPGALAQLFPRRRAEAALRQAGPVPAAQRENHKHLETT